MRKIFLSRKGDGSFFQKIPSFEKRSRFQLFQKKVLPVFLLAGLFYGISHAVDGNKNKISLSVAENIAEKAFHGKIHVKNVFDSQEKEMTGAVVQSSDGSESIAWIHNNTHSMFIGMLVTDSGDNLSKLAYRRHISSSSSESHHSRKNDKNPYLSNTAISVLNQLPSIKIGDVASKKVLYIFGDTNCGHCEDLFSKVTSINSSDDFLIKWIPVAILGEKSRVHAANLMAMPENLRLGALMAHHSHKTELSETLSSAGKSMVAEIDKATEIFSYFGSGTPLVVYQGESGIDIFSGSMPDSELKNLLSKASEIRS